MNCFEASYFSASKQKCELNAVKTDGHIQVKEAVN
jgi:hypothetical protein